MAVNGSNENTSSTVAGSGMTYTGSPIQLINTPTTALPAGYTMKYAVTTENVKPTDEKLYSTEIPTKTEVGTYYVWYGLKTMSGLIGHRKRQVIM